MNGVAYIGTKTRFKYECRNEDSKVLRVRVKATVRKDGSVLSRYPAEHFEGGEWHKTTLMHIVRANGHSIPPKKGEAFSYGGVLGIGAFMVLYDPNPTFEGDDND